MFKIYHGSGCKNVGVTIWSEHCDIAMATETTLTPNRVMVTP